MMLDASLTEWGVVGVIVVLVGLFFTIYNPISKSTKENTKAMTELTVTMKMLTENVSKIEEHNEKSHRRIWEHETSQDEILKDHETRIAVIERKAK